jgi:hypothetical protein
LFFGSLRACIIDPDPGADELHVAQARRLKAVRHVRPVPHVPHRVEKVRLPVLVLQVVRVLPGIEHEQGRARLRQVRLVVVDLCDEELLPERLPHERRPARAHDGRCNGVDLFLEGFEAPELVGDRGGELAPRPLPRLGRQILPEHRMENVAREIEREGFLQRPDVLEAALLTRLGEAIERGIRSLHVAGMMLVVMELHDPAGDVGLECTVVVSELGKRVRGH